VPALWRKSVRALAASKFHSAALLSSGEVWSTVVLKSMAAGTNAARWVRLAGSGSGNSVASSGIGHGEQSTPYALVAAGRNVTVGATLHGDISVWRVDAEHAADAPTLVSVLRGCVPEQIVCGHRHFAVRGTLLESQRSRLSIIAQKSTAVASAVKAFKRLAKSTPDDSAR
jgi:hypothetical protein